MYAPESYYWICGYDTFGFAMFQCLILGADGQFDNGQAVVTAFNQILENAMGSSLICSISDLQKDKSTAERPAFRMTLWMQP
tara:strand:- start:119 stop:364 length:246 start_codon:yes stop_codon:yes gene_type:complete